MKIAKTSLISTSLLAMAACGGGGGGLSGTALTDAYAPLYSDGPTDTASASIVEDGVTGFLSLGGLNSSSLHAFKLRMSDDYATAYLSIDGGPEMTLNGTNTGSGDNWDSNGGFYDPNPSSSSPELVATHTGQLTEIGYTGRSALGGFGWGGIETPPDDLTGYQDFAGNWTGYIYPNSISSPFAVGGGDLLIDLDFGTGEVTGSFTGNMNDGTTTDVSGTISATLNGGRFFGDFNMVGTKWSGNADLAGGTYGDGATDVAGAFAGTATGGGAGQQTFVGFIKATPD